MEKSIALLISNLQEHAHYRDFEELVSHHRPRVPIFDPEKSNVEEWKMKSGMQRGYDLFASLLNIDFED